MDTQPGTYDIQITGVNPVAGYFVNPGDATGSGESLTGISGDAKGLSVRYSGTATGVIGSFTLTFGVAELMNRQLYHITDPLGGYIANKEETLQETVDNLKEDIDNMETRVDQRMAELERKFIVMETALSTLQSQTSWLTGQLDAANRGWW
jgi:flagellar hook-associated protein 2